MNAAGPRRRRALCALGVMVLLAGCNLPPEYFSAPTAEGPPDQIAFVAAIDAARPPPGGSSPIEGIEAKIAARDKAVCAAKPQPEVQGWVGVVMDKNPEASGRLLFSVSIGRNVDIWTWLPEDLDPKTGRSLGGQAEREQQALVAAVKPLSLGAKVAFSGRLQTGVYDPCIHATNFLIRSRLDKPSYRIFLQHVERR